jgi:pyridoxal phosphate phosphatase PHOSPHO2
LADIQQTIFKIIKDETGIGLEELEIIVKSIFLNKGFEDLFNFIRNNKGFIDALLITGNNSIFVDWVLHRHGIKDIFPLYYTNFAEPDEKFLLKVRECHKHTCETCDIAQCKGDIIKNHLEKFYPDSQNIIIFYVGDGENDYCVGKYLREMDILFARKGWKMHKMINENIFNNELNFKCEILTWKDGFSIIDKIKSVLKKLNSSLSKF